MARSFRPWNDKARRSQLTNATTISDMYSPVSRVPLQALAVPLASPPWTYVGVEHEPEWLGTAVSADPASFDFYIHVPSGTILVERAFGAGLSERPEFLSRFSDAMYLAWMLQASR
ncbi:hypothetical protein BAUCODRAFT_127121 [Baudoinia panamericana UAMH 10762]|uniref:Uncharacterized protein n=1 Tax=Baudoinia panamericana (strain UAMH 10762) TaxID=717646 RepID=M2LBH7_BAUPA|nr:uncharacterized protein BAUCODRAFT_127121 [Baudoinia panamericana UAMH 10762]EMC91207.1 hypothetical protein BAUCODRAFT_127121 [Baudoinia panamericana UAMH 10762]